MMMVVICMTIYEDDCHMTIYDDDDDDGDDCNIYDEEYDDHINTF